MNWEQSYVVSRSFTLQIAASGKLIATGSFSRIPQEIDFDAIPVMQCFATPVTPRDALTRLQERWDFDEAGFGEVVDSLIAQNFLTPASSAGGAPPAMLASGGFASVLAHHAMLRDHYRVMTYRSAIAAHVAGRNVVEIGCGTGILSIFAAKAGARKVTAIEESSIAELAREMFDANGCSSVIDLRLGNSRDIELDERADVLIHEIIGFDPLNENVLPYVVDARERLLVEGGRLIPHRLEVFCVGIEVTDKQQNKLERSVAEAGQFAGMYGLDFQPLLRRLASANPRSFTRPMELFDGANLKRRILTEECRLLDIDFYQASAGDFDGSTARTLTIREPGLLGALIVYFRAHLDETMVVSNGPYVPTTSWGHDVRELVKPVAVREGDDIPLRLVVQTVLGKHTLTVDLA